MLDLSATYPDQVFKNDAAYPYGKAKNKVSESDDTGTPWEEKIVRDLTGWMQALADDQSVEPNGTTEGKGQSQILDALKTLAAEIAHTEFDATAAIVADRLGVWSAPLVMQYNQNSRFEYYVFSPDFIATVLQQTDVSDGGWLTIPIEPPYPGLRLSANGVSVYVKGYSGHAALPTNMPTAAVAVYNGSSGTATKLGEATDTSATTGAYETEHVITPTIAARNIAANEILSLNCTGESGTNKLAGFQIQAVLVTFEAQV